MSGVVSIKSGSEQDLLVAVATVGPIAIAVDASSNGFRVYIEKKLMFKLKPSIATIKELIIFSLIIA